MWFDALCKKKTYNYHNKWIHFAQQKNTEERNNPLDSRAYCFDFNCFFFGCRKKWEKWCRASQKRSSNQRKSHLCMCVFTLPLFFTFFFHAVFQFVGDVTDDWNQIIAIREKSPLATEKIMRDRWNKSVNLLWADFTIASENLWIFLWISECGVLVVHVCVCACTAAFGPSIVCEIVRLCWL